MAFQMPFKLSASSSDALASRRARASKMMEYDQPLVWVTLLLMLFGIVMVYSASISLPDSPKYANYKNTHWVVRQAIFVAVALVVGLFVFRVKVDVWQRVAPWAFGITLVARKDDAIVPWAWGINGGMSVIGTVGATIIAINAGFTATFLVGALLYVGAGVTGWWLSRTAD